MPSRGRGVRQASHQRTRATLDPQIFAESGGMARLYDSRKRILVTGGAGFLGSHLIDRLLAAGHEVLCVDNLFTGTKRNIEHLHEQPRFEFMRHDVTLSALCRGRRDLQPGLPGLAHPLPARSGADDQDVGARRHQHAGARQAPEVPHPAGLDQRGVRRPVGAPADPRRTGATSIRSASRSCYDEGKRCAETLFFDYHRQHKLRDQGRAHLQHLRAAHASRPTGAWCRTSSCRR